MPGVDFIDLRDVDERRLEVAVSPFFSLLMATRDAAGAERSRTPEAWCRAIRAHLTQRDYDVLAPLATAERAYVPDAILPVPQPPEQSLQDGLERVIAREEALISDIHLCQSAGRAGDWNEPARDPRRWVRSFVVTLARAWNGFEPVWQLAQDSLAREAERVAAAAARGSQRHVLDTLLPDARVRDGRWEIEGFADEDVGYAIADEGLVVIPLIAGERATMVFDSGMAISHVGYPLHPPGPARRPPSRSLEALLGIPRARLLRALGRPASNGGLAAKLQTVPSAVTHHVTALEAAGLVARERAGRHVIVSRTRRGDALLALYDEE